MTLPSYDDCLRDARFAALDAWQRVAHYRSGGFDVYEKEGEGPATDADREADAAIREYLSARHPAGETAFLTEELAADPHRRKCGRVWIVDPIDGTTEFMRGSEDFAIHIGLAERCHDGAWRPVVAVVYLPVLGVLYSALAGGGATAEQEIRGSMNRGWWDERGAAPDTARFAKPVPVRVSETRLPPDMTAVVTRSNMTTRLHAALQQLPIGTWYRRGSLGVKMMEVAAGRADFYLHTERDRASEWDLCAPHLVLEEAGGRVTGLAGEMITYNREDTRIRAGIVAGNAAGHESVLKEIAKVNELKD